MKNKNVKNKKTRQRVFAVILATILILAMVLGLAAPFFAAEIPNTNITIDAKVGFEGKYKIGVKTPISIFLKNDGASFKGEVQIKVLESQYDVTPTYILYSKSVDLPQGSSKQLDFSIAFPNLQRNVVISLVKDDKIIQSQTITTKAYSGQKVFVGVLTDSSNSSNLLYLKNLGIGNYAEEESSNSYVSTTINGVTQYTIAEEIKVTNSEYQEFSALQEGLIFFDRESFPSSVDILDNLNALIIDDFDTLMLTSEQIGSLSDWISNGGRLILGTGVNEDKVLNGLKSIVDVDINNPDSYIAMDNMYEGAYSVGLEIGKGYVMIHNFDLALSPVCDNPDAPTILADLYKSYMRISEVKQSYNDNSTRYRNLLRKIPLENNNTEIIIMLVIIFIYIIVVGPILYIVLKKFDKLDKAWTIMPAAAVGVTLILFVISIGTVYRNSIMNAISIVKLNNDNSLAQVHTELSIVSPKQGSVIAEFDKDIEDSLNLLNNYDYYRYNSYYDASNSLKEEISYKLLQDDKTKITFYDNESWDSNLLTFDYSAQVNALFEIKSDDGINLDLKNNSEFDLQNVIVVMGTKYAYFEEIQSNEIVTAQIQDVLSQNGYYYGYYDIVENIFQHNDMNLNVQKIKNGELDVKQVRSNIRRANIYDNLLSEDEKYGYSSGYYFSYDEESRAKLYGFTEDFLPQPLTSINGTEPIRYNETVLVSDIRLESEDLRRINQATTELLEISSDALLEVYGGEKMLYLSYPGTITFIFMVYDRDKYYNVTWDRTYSGVQSQREIYNARTNEWEVLTENDYLGTDYTQEDGRLFLRITLQSSTEVYIPNVKTN